VSESPTFTVTLLNRKSDYNLEEGKVVPTVHVLFTLTTAVLEPWNMGTLWNALPEQNKDVRAELIGWIADEGLGGDISAATWLLLMILGRVSASSNVLLNAAELSVDNHGHLLYSLSASRYHHSLMLPKILHRHQPSSGFSGSFCLPWRLSHSLWKESMGNPLHLAAQRTICMLESFNKRRVPPR
jgi:hypothetical protein